MGIHRNLLLSVALVVLCGSTCAAQSLVWHQTNGPYGGNISAMAANSTTVFAGLEYGGLYRSTNEGDFWMRADSGIPPLPITALAANGSLVFAGTDSGVYRSTDDGLSWARVDTVLHGWEIRSIAVSGTLAFAGTYDYRVYRSTDSGVTWNLALNLSDTLLALPSIGVLTIVASNVFAGTYSSESDYSSSNVGNIWRSTDSGKSWSSSAKGIFRALQTIALVSDGSMLLAGCTEGGIYRSDDTGRTWNVLDTSKPFWSIRSLTAMGNILLEATNSDSDLSRSTDTGSSWALVDGFESPNINVFLKQGSNIFAGTEGGVFRSIDSGAIWTRVDSGMIKSNSDALCMDSSGVLYSGTYGEGVFRTGDDGSTWTAVGNGSGDSYVRGVGVCEKNIFAATNHQLFEIGIDSSAWGPAGLAESDPYLRFYSIAASGSLIYAGGDYAEHSSDAGASWTIDSSLGDVGCFLILGNKTFVGAGGGALFVTADSGSIWSQESIHQNATAQTLVATKTSLFAGLYDGLFRSEDNGVTWVRTMSGLPQFSVNALTAFGSNVGAGTSGGFYLSTNNGETWISENAGLNDLQVFALAIKGDTLFAGTKTGGVYWTDISKLSSSVTSPRAANSLLVLLNPDPVSSITTFRFELTNAQPVSLRIFDPLGREVWHSFRELPAGKQSLDFNAQNLASGAYFYEIREGSAVQNGTMLVAH